MNTNIETRRVSRSFESVRRASLAVKMEIRRASESGLIFICSTCFLKLLFKFYLLERLWLLSPCLVYFSQYYPKCSQKAFAWLIILLSAVNASIPMFQSGLLFTKIDFTCSNSTDDCECKTYQHPFWSGNLITEFNLYCDRAYLVGVSDLCFFSGKLFSGVFGFFLDKFTRKWTWLITSLLTTLLTGLQATASSILIYSGYRFLQGIFDQLLYQEMF